MKTLKDYIKDNIDEYAWIFTVVKPGFLEKSQDIIKRFEMDGWSVWRTKPKQLLLSEAYRLYKVHKNESFYKDLCKYMSSGVSRAIIFKKDGKVDDDMFNEVKKIKDEIREKYGESDMRNVLHSSDSLEHMKEEASIYFQI